MIKTLISLKASGTVLALLIIISCSTSKKMALSCPQPESRYKSKVTLNHPSIIKKSRGTSHRNKKFNNAFGNYTYKQKNTSQRTDYIKHKQLIFPPEPGVYLNLPSRTEYLANIYASAENQASVNKAILSELESKDELAYFQADETVYERAGISPTRTIYSETNLPNYSYTSISPSKTSSTKTKPQESIDPERKKNGLSVAGLVFSIAGLIITGIPGMISLSVAIRTSLVGLMLVGIPLGVIAIVLSARSLIKSRRNPDRYSGKRLALASLIIGSIDIIAVLMTLIILITRIMF